MRLRHTGTTLFELTTTLGLLSVVLAMALPAFSAYTQQARTNRAVGEISAISARLHQWRASNGDGSFPASLTAAGIYAGQDPWGNPYAYMRIDRSSLGEARTDGRSRLLNSDFDLYSIGPDGETGPALDDETALDDIIRAADGAFIGLAARY